MVLKLLSMERNKFNISIYINSLSINSDCIEHYRSDYYNNRLYIFRKVGNFDYGIKMIRYEK